jgi:Tfp pilus assembly protein PilE
MSEVTKTFKYSQSGQKGSLLILVIVLLTTIGFAVYNNFLKSDINKISAQIREHETRIEKLESQKSVYIYSLIKRHQKVLDEMDERSMITKYMDHLQAMKAHYDFDLRGFQF